MEDKINEEFWDSNWQTGQTGWDIGYPSPAIIDYVDRNVNKSSSILIPGCGNAYEAEYLANNNFQDITLIDISKTAVNNLKSKFKQHPNVNIIHSDFFEHKGQYDIIIEQTFFCALNPELRNDYAKQMSKLLKPTGNLFGLLFKIEFEKEGPPFGGSESEYRRTFEPYFNILEMEDCNNSIPKRFGNELFFKLGLK